METLNIEIDDGRSAFAPGESLSGTASWTTEKPVESVEIRLFWRIKGTTFHDVQITDSTVFANAKTGDTRRFSFVLPAAPYSFTGSLMSLVWSLELVLQPKLGAHHIEFVLTPNREPIILKSLSLNPDGTDTTNLKHG